LQEKKMAAATVLHIITKLELGGAQQNTLYIVEHLDRETFSPALFAGPGGMLDHQARELPARGIPFETVPHLIRSIRPWNDYRAYRELRRMIRALKPSIVHTHSSKAGVLGRLAAAAERVPVIIHTIHGFGFGAATNKLIRRALLAAERRAARVTTLFIPVSDENMRAGRELGLLNEHNASVVLEGVELRPFREATRKPELLTSLGIPAGAPLVGMVACFKPQKDPLTFIEAAAKVHAEIPDARFLLIGAGELRPRIEARIAELGLSQIVVLAGWRTDVPELFKLMSVSVLTSLWEGLPRVIPQSLSAQVPVVVTRAGGSPEAVIEGKTGFVLDIGDAEGIARKIVWLLRNHDQRRAMGEAGPVSVAGFDIDKMVMAHEEIYRKLLAEKEGK
jgi:glycosyltransferase involved in cell wall biosynthesis